MVLFLILCTFSSPIIHLVNQLGSWVKYLHEEGMIPRSPSLPAKKQQKSKNQAQPIDPSLSFTQNPLLRTRHNLIYQHHGTTPNGFRILGLWNDQKLAVFEAKKEKIQRIKFHAITVSPSLFEELLSWRVWHTEREKDRDWYLEVVVAPRTEWRRRRDWETVFLSQKIVWKVKPRWEEEACGACCGDIQTGLLEVFFVVFFWCSSSFFSFT